MKKYNLINNISGWTVFLAAAVVYLLTIEPTVSLWDCGEYIASAYKLEVGHPPGNPVFMVLGRFFALFAGGDSSRVAAMINSMSALASAFTILFLFWTITHLARKIILKSEADYSVARITAVITAGVVGALAYTFSDSFWFSAVEGEVYATSSLFTAVVFWAILKWENMADEEYADRWIILIAFLMGLSIGVHLLNLLAIPAIGLVYYFRRFEFTWKGFFISFTVSVMILALLLYGIIPGVVKISSRFDLFFVNKIGFSSNSGMVIHIVLLAVMLILSLRYTYLSKNVRKTTLITSAALLLSGIWVISGSLFLNILVFAAAVILTWRLASKNRSVLNTAMTVITVILIGYSSIAIIVIRASVNTPLNENNPSNPFNLLYFINREQYGDRPLFYGPYYNAPTLDYLDGKPKYALEEGKYVITGYNLEREYDKRFLTLFPRLWSDRDEHIGVYEEWGDIRGTPVQVTDQQSGERTIIRKPKFSENLRFMFSYQFGYMYFRYFMWNFAGKQNDTQGTGGSVNGNWISGIRFLDEMRTGTYDMPDSMESDTSRNRYFLLPFLLGLAGMYWHYKRDNKDWGIILLLFIMTGIAVVFYLNQDPNQPRERDYAYAASFYFFSVWIGLGVLVLYEWILKVTGEKIAAPLAGIICFLAVPVVMGSGNWDDHDRSGRYMARDIAFNYLKSCAPGSILFTNGDNDTFPLWYAQEVEGVGTDIRVCNLMLLNTDWYINQMKQKTYDSEPLPISLPVKKYYDGVNNQVFIYERTEDPVDISVLIDWIMSENNATKLQFSSGEMFDMIPSRTIRIPVDAEKVIESGTVKQEDADKIVPYIDINLTGSSILKSQLLVLDILANNRWERPVYFVTGYHEDAMGLEEYFQLEGLVYRLVPIKSHNNNWLDYGRIDTDILYENMVKKFTWGNPDKENVNFDYHHKRTISVVKARSNYARLAKALADEGKNEKAVEALEFCMNSLPLDKFPYDPYMPDIIEACFAAGATGTAVEMVNNLCEYYYQRLDYYLRQDPYIINSAEFEIYSAYSYTMNMVNTCTIYGQREMAEEINNRLERYSDDYMRVMQPAANN